MDYMKKDIPGYEGMYQIDTEGVVYALNRHIIKASGWCKKPKPFEYQARLLQPILQKGTQCSRWFVHLYDENHKRISFDIAMIVAHVFLGCPVMKNNRHGKDKYRVWFKDNSLEGLSMLTADNLFWKQTKKDGVRVV